MKTPNFACIYLYFGTLLILSILLLGINHFVFNMIMQILVGVFLEMQQEGWQGSFRVMTVYFSGVIAGSLGTSLSDPQTYIAGNQTDRVLLTFTVAIR